MIETREQFEREAAVWKDKLLEDRSHMHSPEFKRWSVDNIDWLWMITSNIGDGLRPIKRSQALVSYQHAGDRPFIDAAARLWCCPACSYPPYRKPFACDNPACLENAWHTPEWREELRRRFNEAASRRDIEAKQRAQRAALIKQGFAVPL